MRIFPPSPLETLKPGKILNPKRVSVPKLVAVEFASGIDDHAKIVHYWARATTDYDCALREVFGPCQPDIFFPRLNEGSAII